MPLSGENKKINEDGTDKEAFVVSFTNGAKEQIESLKQHFKAPDELEIIKLGISVLQRIKEQEDKKGQDPDEPK